MRILFCNFEYPPLGGGGGVVNSLLAEELARRHAVTVLTSLARGLPARSVEKGVQVLRVPVFFRWREATASMVSMLSYLMLGIRAGRKHLATHRYDVINSHFALPSGPVGDALARSSGIPHVLSVHGGDLYDPSKLTSPHRHPLLRLWIRRLALRADAVVGQSTNTLENLRRFYTPDLPAHRIPLGIRRPGPGAALRTSYGVGDSEVLFITVGRLVRRKAIDQLLRAVQTLRELPLRLFIVGSGPLEEALKCRADALGISGRVLFLGKVEEAEKFRLLRMCDVFVSASQHEGFGLVFLEAMACGLPVVCYDHGGQTDFLEEGTTGHVLPLNDERALITRCRALAEDGALRRKLGQENLRRVEAYFIETCAAQYERLYEQLQPL